MASPDFIEISTDDQASTKAFFQSVMGWTWEDMPDGRGGYFTDGTRKVGMHEEPSALMVPYLSVKNIEETVKRVTKEGGTVMGVIADAPGLGRFATCSDPRGVRFGLHQE